jgi:predicted DNA-binding transcriptional regulator YafY
MADEALVRLINLYELLIATRQPLTQLEICDLVPGFPASAQARARAFERAKASLRALGVPLVVTNLPGRSQVGYSIDPSEAFIEVDLTREERRALSSALGSISLVGGSLGGLTGILGLLQAARAPLLWDMRGLDRMAPEIAEAVASRRMLGFGYGGRPRWVAPFGVILRLGTAYLVAKEGGRTKTFRVDRVTPPLKVGAPHQEESPASIGELLAVHPWQLQRHPAVSVLLEGAPEELQDLAGHLDDERHARVEATNLEALLIEVIRHAPKVRVVEPASAVNMLAAHLGAVEAMIGTTLVVGTPKAVEPDRSVRTAAEEQRPTSRLERRFVLLTRAIAYLAQRPRPVPLAEIGSVVGLRDGEIADLLESAALTGLPPYSPDALLEVLVDREGGTAELLDDSELSGTLQVGILEAFALLAGLELLGRVLPRDAPQLVVAVEKLRGAISARLPAMPAIEAPSEAPEAAIVLLRAVAAGACVEFAYHGAQHGAGRRHVRPVQLFVMGGAWYLLALRDHERRHYRVDRIREAEVVATDACHAPAEVEAAQATLDRSDPLGVRRRGRRQRLVVPRELRWVLERFAPGAYDELEGDEVQVFSLGDTWLAGLLIGLGPGTEAVVPAHVIDEVRRLLRELRTIHMLPCGARERCQG